MKKHSMQIANVQTGLALIELTYLSKMRTENVGESFQIEVL
jgi:hypothetical protein